MLRYLAVAAGGLLFMEACTKPKPPQNDQEKASYIIGHQIGSNFKKNEMPLNVDQLKSGLMAGLEGKDSLINQEETQKVMQAFQMEMQKKSEGKAKEQGEKNSTEGKKWLDENSKKAGVVTLPSGLQYKIVKEGTGAVPKATDTVVTHYKGTLIDGTEFDSSYKRNEPATFPVNGVIKGWTEALQLMKVGSKWELYVPPELGYGERGAGPQIGPNSVLVFEIELMDIKK